MATTYYKIRDKNTGLFCDNGREFDNLYKALQHSFGKSHLVVVKFEEVGELKATYGNNL